MRIEKDRLILDLTCSNYERNYDAFLFTDNEVYLLLKNTSRESKNEKIITQKLINGKLENTKNYYLYKTSFKFQKIDKKYLYDFFDYCLNLKDRNDEIQNKILKNTIELNYVENFIEEKSIKTTFEERKQKIISMFNYYYLENKFENKKEEKKLKI